MHGCMHAHICAWAHTCTHMYIHTCTHAHSHAHTHKHTHTHTYTYIHTHTYTPHTHNALSMDHKRRIKIWYPGVHSFSFFQQPLISATFSPSQPASYIIDLGNVLDAGVLSLYVGLAL